jgi:hypothetical protein
MITKATGEKKMKKIIIAFTMLFFATMAYAETKIDLVKHTRPGGLNDRMINVVAEALGDRFGKFIETSNCLQAKKVLENSKTPVATVWSSQTEHGSQPCNLDDSMLLSTFTNSPYHITYFAENKEASLEHLKTGKDVKVGLWDSNFWSAPQRQFLIDLNPNIKTIRYKSKPLRTALASGEIDYKVLSFPGKDPVLAALGENDYGVITGQDLLPGHPFADLGYQYLLVGVGIDIDLASTVFESEAWANRRDTTHKPYLQDLSREKQLSTVMVMLDKIYQSGQQQ